MIFIGIDPGLNGGVALLEPGQQPIELHVMPTIAGKDYDVQALKDILKAPLNKGAGVLVTFEQQHALPGQGLTSTLQTGKGYGILLGLIAGLDIPHQIISARVWQKELFTGVAGKLDTKAKSEIIAKRLFPYADFRRSKLAKKNHDGITDAACIAEYGRRSYFNDAPRGGSSVGSPPEYIAELGQKRHIEVPPNWYDEPPTI